MIGLTSRSTSSTNRPSRRVSRPAATSKPTWTIAVASVATAMIPEEDDATMCSRGVSAPGLLEGFASAIDGGRQRSRALP